MEEQGEEGEFELPGPVVEEAVFREPEFEPGTAGVSRRSRMWSLWRAVLSGSS